MSCASLATPIYAWWSREHHDTLSALPATGAPRPGCEHLASEGSHAPGRYRLHIVGEVTVAVRHCLLALPGVAKGDLRRVVSHYQALAQCDGYIRRLPGVVREAADDTAGAAKAIADTSCRHVTTDLA